VFFAMLTLAMVAVVVGVSISAARWRRSRQAGKVAAARIVGTLIFTVLAVVGVLAVGYVAMIALFNAQNH
jgi:hypothetical protein